MTAQDPVSRRAFVQAAAGVCAAVVATPVLAAPMLNRGRFRLFGASGRDYSARAIALVQRSVVIDMLGVFTLDFPQQAKWEKDPESFTAAQFQKFKDSGINVFHPAVGLGGVNAYETALQWFAGWNAFLAGNDERLMRIDSPADFGRVKQSGKVGVLLGLQNAQHSAAPTTSTCSTASGSAWRS
jgi:membrane dipeptidase